MNAVIHGSGSPPDTPASPRHHGSETIRRAKLQSKFVGRCQTSCQMPRATASRCSCCCCCFRLPEGRKWPLKRQISTISANFKRGQENAAPHAYVCPRTSSSKQPK